MQCAGFIYYNIIYVDVDERLEVVGNSKDLEWVKIVKRLLKEDNPNSGFSAWEYTVRCVSADDFFDFNDEQVTPDDFKAPDGKYRIIAEYADMDCTEELEIVGDFHKREWAKKVYDLLLKHNEKYYFTLCNDQGAMK